MASIRLKINKIIGSFSWHDKAFILLLVLFSFFSLYMLGNMIFNNDAHFWYERTFNFIDAIKSFDFASTYQNPKPGVTVMWLSGLSGESFLSLYNLVYGFRPQLYTFDTFRYIHLSTRLPLVILNIAFVAYFYYLLKKLLNVRVALFSSIFLIFQPFFIATSRIFHADSTLTVFMNLSMLFLLKYLVLEQNTKKLVFSGIFGGLAILTKLSGVFLVPYTALILLVYVFYNKRSLFGYPKMLLTWTLVALFTFFSVFPAMWVKPDTTINKLYTEVFELRGTGRDGISPFNEYFEIIPEYTTPLLLLAASLGLIVVLLKGNKVDKKERLVIQSFVLFTIFYLLQMSLMAQKMPRYIVPLFPALAVLGDYGFNYLLSLIEHKFEKYLTVGLVLVNLYPVISYFPHYSLYVTLLGKDTFDCSMCSEVGGYINSLEKSPEFTVVVDSDNPQRLHPFIKGNYLSHKEVNQDTKMNYVIQSSDSANNVYPQCLALMEFTFKKEVYWTVLECDSKDQ